MGLAVRCPRRRRAWQQASTAGRLRALETVLLYFYGEHQAMNFQHTRVVVRCALTGQQFDDLRVH